MPSLCFCKRSSPPLRHAKGTEPTPATTVGSGILWWYQLAWQAFKLFNEHKGFSGAQPHVSGAP